MSKRRDPEAEVVQFFLHANEHTVFTVFRIVRGIMAQRGLLRPALEATTTPRRRRAKTTNGDLLEPEARTS